MTTKIFKTKKTIFLGLVLLATVPQSAQAHPHVLVNARVEVVVNGAKEMTAIRHQWEFDEAFSAFSVQGLDKNNDKIYSRDELQPLAEINVTSLAEFTYFTKLTQNKQEIGLEKPVDYFLEYREGKLTLNFTQPLTKPLVVTAQKAELEVYDPTYFVAFGMQTHNPISLSPASDGCKAAIEMQAELPKLGVQRFSDAEAQNWQGDPLGSQFSNKIIIECQKG